ncbi:MAG TPA: hypothetical protein VF324_10625 [Methanobacterium sp.]
MKTLEFDSQMDSRKKLMTILFWTNRKAARTEGCAPFLLKKIVTEENTYTPEDPKTLKLTDDIINDIVQSIDQDKPVKFEILMGTEYINAEIDGNIFTVNTEHSEEIEEEIVEKLDTELNKKFPSICESFKPRVTPNK